MCVLIVNCFTAFFTWHYTLDLRPSVVFVICRLQLVYSWLINCYRQLGEPRNRLYTKDGLTAVI